MSERDDSLLTDALLDYERARVKHDRAAAKLYRLLDRRVARSKQLASSLTAMPIGPMEDKARIIIECVAKFFHVLPADITGPRRPENFVTPRHLAMVYIRSLLRVPYQRIGIIFGGRDHGTVLNAERAVRTRCTVDAAYMQTHDFLLQQCREALEQAGKQPAA